MLQDEKDCLRWTSKTTRAKLSHIGRRTPTNWLNALKRRHFQIPGLNNAWTMPIKTRLNMLATGIKTPVGIKVADRALRNSNRIASENRSGCSAR